LVAWLLAPDDLRLGRGDDRNRTGVDGFAARRKALLSACLSGARGSQVFSGALKKRSYWESFGRGADSRVALQFTTKRGWQGPKSDFRWGPGSLDRQSRLRPRRRPRTAPAIGPPAAACGATPSTSAGRSCRSRRGLARA